MERTFIDIEAAPDDLLRRLGKDSRLVPYGGANFGMPLDLIEPANGRTVRALPIDELKAVMKKYGR